MGGSVVCNIFLFNMFRFLYNMLYTSPFRKNTSDSLDPLRIAAVPGITLDIVVTGQLVSPESSSHNSVSSSNLATNTIRQNPLYGLVEEALENYTHIDNPATAPACQGARPTPNNQLPVQGNYDDSKPQHSLSNAQLTHAPQEYTSGITRDFAQTLMRVQPGDKDGQGVAQDYQAAMDWYIKAAEQNDPIGQRKVDVLYDKSSVSPRMTRLLWHRTLRQPNKEVHLRNITSAICATIACVYPKTTPRQWIGIGRLWSKDSLTLTITSP
jgi:hypothetical protein